MSAFIFVCLSALFGIDLLNKCWSSFEASEWCGGRWKYPPTATEKVVSGDLFLKVDAVVLLTFTLYSHISASPAVHPLRVSLGPSKSDCSG